METRCLRLNRKIVQSVDSHQTFRRPAVSSCTARKRSRWIDELPYDSVCELHNQSSVTEIFSENRVASSRRRADVVEQEVR